VKPPRAPAELLSAFDERDRDVRLQASKIAHVLIAVLVLAGTSLDHFVYPELAGEFFRVRLWVALFSAAALALHYTGFVRRNVRWFAMLAPLLVNAAISWMVFRSEGPASPYYAGLNLVLVGIGVLVPWSFGEALLACAFTLAVYVSACMLEGSIGKNLQLLFSNVYFLLLTSVICITAAYFKRKARVSEFRLSSELARSYEQVSELERLKTEFFANVSHELRTPLTLILAPLGDLANRADRLAPELSELIQIARDNSLRLLRLINDLLEVARLESEEFKLRPEAIELGEFVQSQVESVRPIARLKGLELAVEPPVATAWVDADPAHLEKILVNLLTNAIKFTPRGGRVGVGVRVDGSRASVSVKDTGIGISAADLPQVFERFRQADGSSGRRFSGVGIGLSLARELAQKHGGSLSAESELDQGSTFFLYLPLRENGVSATPSSERSGMSPSQREAEDSLVALLHDADRFIPATEEATSSPSETASDGRPTVLVIDDEPDMRRYLASLLTDQYRVLEARDGLEGLELARKQRPELVLLDLMMPGMDGWQVCRELKGSRTDDAPKVVVVTARTDEMAKIAALKQGADDFMSKPFSALEVRTRLSNLRHAHELERNLRVQNAELTEAVQKLRSAEALLVQREKMKAVVRMAGGVLHEINNPLNFTLTAIGIALDRYSDGDATLRSILEDVRAGMLRIRDIVADLRAFANPGATTRLEEFRLYPLVDQALRFTGGELENVEVECDVPADCPVYGSKSQLLQVLTNLILNASAALKGANMDRKKPKIRLSAEVSQGKTRVSVWDNGTGIPDHLIDKVFDPFLTTRDVGQGMGLGLSICHALVVAHGGEIRIRSQLGSWTEVAFELPLRQTGVFA
jgi:signal transduction histidine kinase